MKGCLIVCILIVLFIVCWPLALAALAVVLCLAS